ncbi:MAG: D-alanyl-D-alanine carboxypeptidase family protein, partial [Acidobacteriota bacterium]|nr:D-alanyl-D-alanine carboxypeptidase family protein [Acidobacteriota bacterium]
MFPIPPALLQAQQNPPRAARLAPRGHLPYAEAPAQRLVALSPGIEVRRNALEPLTRLLKAAELDGVPLRVAAGFRSVEIQRETFEAGARKKGISRRSYAWWTAPPGFSEHHTGLAVDFVDPGRPRTNF